MKIPFQKGCHSSQEQRLFDPQLLKRTLPQAAAPMLPATCTPIGKPGGFQHTFQLTMARKDPWFYLETFQILILRRARFLTKSTEAEKNPERLSLSYLGYETACGTSDRRKGDICMGFPGGASGKEPACQCGRRTRHRFKPWVRKIPWRRTCNPLQYSCLENPADREAWWWLQSIGWQTVRHIWSNFP